eukprot:SAG31_NODE_1347_length_8693_cov_32.744938_9_plen_212_part_00
MSTEDASFFSNDFSNDGHAQQSDFSSQGMAGAGLGGVWRILPSVPMPVAPPSEYLTLVQAADGATLVGAAEVDQPEFTLQGAVAGSGTVILTQRFLNPDDGGGSGGDSVVRWSARLARPWSAPTDPALEGRLVDGEWSGPTGSGTFVAVRVEYHPPALETDPGGTNSFSHMSEAQARSEEAAMDDAAMQMAAMADRLGRSIHPVLIKAHCF